MSLHLTNTHQHPYYPVNNNIIIICAQVPPGACEEADRPWDTPDLFFL